MGNNITETKDPGSGRAHGRRGLIFPGALPRAELDSICVLKSPEFILVPLSARDLWPQGAEEAPSAVLRTSPPS